MSNVRNPEERMLRAQMGALLEASIDALPDIYRTVFVLRELEQMSTAEIAQALDITEEVVRIRLHRARALLQTDLYCRVRATTPRALRFHLSLCDRVVSAVLARIHTMSSSPKLLQ